MPSPSLFFNCSPRAPSIYLLFLSLYSLSLFISVWLTLFVYDSVMLQALFPEIHPKYALPFQSNNKGQVFCFTETNHVLSFVRYVSNPKSFRIRVWSAVPGFDGKLKHLELYVVVFGSFVDLCIELLYSTHLKFFVGGIVNPNHMNNFEHAGMLLMFFIFGVVTLLSEKTRFLPLPDGALCLIAATAFCAEYLLFYFHSTNHKGLEGYYHVLLVLLIGLCILSTVAGALLPTSFPVDLCNGIAVTLQGLWFYQTAFTLYGPMMPDGCRLKDGQIKCRSLDSEARGELLANFQLFSLVLGTLVAAVVSYIFAASRYGQSNVKSLHVVRDALG